MKDRLLYLQDKLHYAEANLGRLKWALENEINELKEEIRLYQVATQPRRHPKTTEKVNV